MLVPAIVNLLLLFPAVCDVAGEPKDWISFWGSYSGALLTGIVSFAILYRTVKSNKQTTDATIAANQKATEDTIRSNELSIQKQLNFTRGVDFRTTTARCLSHLDVEKYTIIYLQLDNGASPEFVSKELMECHSTIIEDLSSFELQYANRYPNFTEAYRKLAKDISFMVGVMAAYVYNVPTNDNGHGLRASELSKVKAMATNIKDNNKEALANLSKLAQELLLPN